MRRHLALTLLIFGFTSPLPAQQARDSFVSTGIIAGAYIPVNEHSNQLATTVTLGFQVRHDFNEYLGLTGTVWWAGSEVDVPSLGEEPLDLYQYDLGLEFRLPPPPQQDPAFTPFVGIGAGGRTYDYRDLCGEAETDLTAFASLGFEIVIEPYAFRLEGRGYVSDFDGYVGEQVESERREGLTLTAGLLYRF
jgi:hypothetical protein